MKQINLRDGKKMSQEEILAIEKIKSQFNSKRQLFNFSHLDTLVV